MSLVVVATFISLTEAQIASGALQSGGLHPVAMDQGFGSVVWTEQMALQGFRLAVPASEAVEAREFFAALPARRVRRRRLRFGETLWRILIPTGWFLGGAPLAWLMVGCLRRRRPGAGREMLMGMAGTTVVLLVIPLLEHGPI